MILLSHSRIGIIIFRPILPRSREFTSFFFGKLLILTTCSAFNSTLINGKGRFPGGPSDVPLAIVNVKQGKRSVLGQVFWVQTFSSVVTTDTDSALFPSLATPALFSPSMAINSPSSKLRVPTFSPYSSIHSKYLPVSAAQTLFLVLLINAKTGQRYSLVV
jgi:hypothetical protein